MADLTVGEIGKVLRLNLSYIDETVNPPVQNSLNLAGATVQLIFTITSPQTAPKNPTIVSMAVVDATNGIVSYTFQSGDLVKPPEMSKFGVFRYAVKVTLPGGIVIFSDEDGNLKIKDDSVI